MAVDVRVRRCTLTIRRRDGWSWGPSPQPHIDAALSAIEAAIGSALVEASVDASVDAQLDATVRLEIGPDGVTTLESWTALVEQLRALPSACDPPPADSPAASAAPPGARDAPLPAFPGIEHRGAALARTLAAWSRSGQMARVVAAWPEAILRAWLDAVAATAGTGAAPTVTGTLADEAVRAIAAALLGGAAPAAADSRAEAERLLLVIGAVAAALGDRLPNVATQTVVREVVGATPARQPPAPGRDAVAQAPAELSAAAPRGAPEAPAPTHHSAEIVPALPLLVLAQLGRIGYADAMEAAAQAAGLPGGGAALGAAVAGKALPPPARGWQREREEHAVIATAAGHRTARDWPAAVARAADALVPPLRSALLAAYAEGRSANDPVLVTATGDGVLVGEEEGLLPIAWVADRDELDAALKSLGCPPVRRSGAFRAVAEALGPRHALPRLDAVALERHLGAAVGTALGVLALDLWGEDATPLLALERLGDLEVRAEPTPSGLVVGIPRGRRWLDLSRGGMLRAFRIPWLSGATLELATW